jgi:hypothetical protein
LAKVEDGATGANQWTGKCKGYNVRKREVRAQYLNNLLLDAPSFRADAINGRLMSFQCYKKLATWSRRQYYGTWL